MTARGEFASTLTGHCQTTTPRAVRVALKFSKHENMRAAVRLSGAALPTSTSAQQADYPVLGQHIHFLARDSDTHSESVRAVYASRLKRISIERVQ